mgnify:FL=1
MISNHSHIEFESFFDDIFSKASSGLLQILSHNPSFVKRTPQTKLRIEGTALSDYFSKKFTEIATKSLPEINEMSLHSIGPQKSMKVEKAESDIQDVTGMNQNSIQSIADVKISESVFVPAPKANFEESTKSMKSSTGSLMDSSGFRFIIKYENGRPRFVAVPVSSLELEKNNSLISSEPKPQGNEFENKILTHVSHDLDADLPAPYSEGLTQRKVN